MNTTKSNQSVSNLVQLMMIVAIAGLLSAVVINCYNYRQEMKNSLNRRIVGSKLVSLSNLAGKFDPVEGQLLLGQYAVYGDVDRPATELKPVGFQEFRAQVGMANSPYRPATIRELCSYASKEELTVVATGSYCRANAEGEAKHLYPMAFFGSNGVRSLVFIRNFGMNWPSQFRFLIAKK